MAVVGGLEIVDIVLLVVPVVSDIELAAGCIRNDVAEMSVGDGDCYMASFTRGEHVSE